jgi:hypothetical protein
MMSFTRTLAGAIALLLLGLPWGASDALGQCLLANPSFELSGPPGRFAGWNQFGVVGSTTNAPHGSAAARVTGPDQGGWDVSAFWQPLDTSPGERWSASVPVWHSSTRPLTGESRAILNIEWRDSGGALIDFESHTAADATTPTDEVILFAVESQAVPPGAVTARLLLGVLQSPTDPPPDVFYDLATFDNLGPPTIEELQWLDFPGGRTIDFSGRTWRVKGPGFYGPGPNLFCDTASCTWVDAQDRLHLTVQNIGNSWHSTEVALEEALGYGDYIFTTFGRLDDLHPNVVFGLFLWEYGRCFDPQYSWWNPNNEFDIEFSRWGNPANDVGQFVAQPYDFPGNISRFDAIFGEGELTSHAFRWLPDRVECRSWRGGPADEMPSNLIHTWTYAGPHIPRPEQPRVHLNLWQFNSPPATDQEVVLDAFTFIPAGGSAGIAEDAAPLHRPSAALAVARPNPFNPHTTISYALTKDDHVEIVVYDAAGRPVRDLVKS